ncbi:unnamed protein product [Rotaria sordida]|uniref:Uncharacterized protein n=1 Tax=Rotaria sordida TaxID=392033 RepID=A0A814F0A9_9BILA|nr:unnamed protein product [Rotaria sordida]CAF0979283.1 unnamed protein product [Rotaria sordida]
MESEFSSNPDNLMNTNNQLDSTLCLPTNYDVSYGNTTNSTENPISRYWTPNLLDGALFIVSNSTYQTENIPSSWQHPTDLLTRTFDDITKLKDNPGNFFHGLINAYADLYDIDLYLIVSINNKHTIIDKNHFGKLNEKRCDKERYAFIFCNTNNIYCCPLYYKKYINGETLTVFKRDDISVWHAIETMVNQMNKKIVDENQNQTENRLELSIEDPSHMAVDDTFSSENHSTSFDLQPVILFEASTFIEQMLQEINQLKNNLRPWLNEILIQNQAPDFNITNLNSISPQASAELIQERQMLILQIIQSAVERIPRNHDAAIVSNIVVANNNQQDNTTLFSDTSHVTQIDQNPANISSFVLNQSSNTSEIFPTTSASIQCEAPNILNKPKKDWHYRNMRDLAKNRIPLLAGDGPQRSLIRVKVPLKRNYPMYLGIKVQTYDNREHCLKIPVPEGTTVNMDSFCNDNNLNRLQFDQCTPTDYFDSENRYVYSEISSEEHEAREKE